jgi:hypothetical protein
MMNGKDERPIAERIADCDLAIKITRERLVHLEQEREQLRRQSTLWSQRPQWDDA